MKIFFLGEYIENTGPSNVNRALIENSDDQFLYLHSVGKIRKLLETLKYLKMCDIVLISGICSEKYLELIKKYKKKYVYVLHGDLIYEKEINNEDIKQSVLDTQMRIFKEAEKIICVSENYAGWVATRYPHYKNKITFVNNGLNISIREKKEKIPYSIAISGANRPIKANKYVCKAANIIHNSGVDCKVYVFGRKYENCDDLPNTELLQYMSHLDTDEYYNQLDKISTFVINSDVESFSLSVGDALNCNCSILMSENVGATSIFKLTDEDILHDNHNPEEIADKIMWIEKHPNAERLFSSLDLNNISVKASYNRIVQICKEVVNE